ncbi:MAG: ROK family transcriptional regulator [Caldisericaceae bacterium]|nr:ROK family transcriptional regulator [Caldisericaceae bacterium]
MKGKNQRFLKEENTSVILKLIKENPGISRADIVRISGLTAPTVSRLTNKMVENGIINEKKAEITGVGRKPFGLYFNENAFYIIGIDFSYLHITGALVNLSGKIKERKTMKVNSNTFSEKDIPRIVNLVNYLISRKGKSNILGIGFSSPGMVDHKNGILISIPHFPNFKNVPIKEILESEFGLCTVVSNDANAEAVGEKHFGFGKNVSDFVLLHLGYGIGMGIIIRKKLYTGNFGVSGEIGHTSVDRKTGKKCDCGNVGCVELYAGLKGILEDVSAVLNKKVTSVSELKKLIRNKKVSSVIKEKGELIGYVLVNVVNLLAPEKIIVTGSVVSSIGEPIIKPIKETIDARSFYGVGKRIPIILSELGKNCTLVGAATTVLEYFLEKPYDFIET